MAIHETHYVALIHKDPASGYGVSFPDVPGVIAVADSLDEAMSEGAAALQFAFEDWVGALPVPRLSKTSKRMPIFSVMPKALPWPSSDPPTAITLLPNDHGRLKPEREHPLASQ